MVQVMDFERYWQDCIRQDKESLRTWFWPDARIIWPCTEEVFTVEEFLLANCEYPGVWSGELLNVIQTPMGAVTECRIVAADGKYSCHVASIFTVYNGKIASLTEYYADDGPPPQWRVKLMKK